MVRMTIKWTGKWVFIDSMLPEVMQRSVAKDRIYPETALELLFNGRTRKKA